MCAIGLWAVHLRSLVHDSRIFPVTTQPLQPRWRTNHAACTCSTRYGATTIRRRACQTGIMYRQTIPKRSNPFVYLQLKTEGTIGIKEWVFDAEEDVEKLSEALTEWGEFSLRAKYSVNGVSFQLEALSQWVGWAFRARLPLLDVLVRVTLPKQKNCLQFANVLKLPFWL